MMKHTSVNVRVDDDLKERIAKLAKLQGMSISELVREWFIDCVELEERALADELREMEAENGRY